MGAQQLHLSFIQYFRMKEKELKSLLVIVVGLLVFYLIFNNAYFIYASVAIGGLSLLIPTVGKGINWVWFKIAEVLGWINSRILLSLLYYIFLTPISLLYRIFKKNSLDIKAPSKSIYEERNHIYSSKDLDNPW